MRLFFCLELPVYINQELVQIQHKLQKLTILKATYVQPHNLHCTLAFLGDMPDTALSSILAQAQTIKFPRFQLTLQNICISSQDTPCVLWISLNSPELSALACQVQQLFVPTKNNQTFTGHITLARIKQVYNQADFDHFLDNIHIPKISWTVTEFTLKQSVLHTQGPMYTTLKNFYLIDK